MIRAWIKPVLMFAVLLAVALALRMLPIAAPAAWRPLLAGGPLPQLGFVALAALATALGLPRQAIAFAAGYALGPVRGGALALFAQVLGAALDFAYARVFARARLRDRLRGRLARLDGFLAGHPFTATLTLRLLPVGNNMLLNLAAGCSGIAVAPFLAASALGYLPQTIIFALLGSGGRLGGDVTLMVAAATLLVAVALSGWLWARFRGSRRRE